MLVPPRFVPPLDPDFRPAALANRVFLAAVRESGAARRWCSDSSAGDGSVSRFETEVFEEGHPSSGSNLPYAERLLKFLLWQRGACKVHVGGPASVGQHLAACYTPGGLRDFDYHFMAETSMSVRSRW